MLRHQCLDEQFSGIGFLSGLAFYPMLSWLRIVLALDIYLSLSKNYHICLVFSSLFFYSCLYVIF